MTDTDAANNENPPLGSSQFHHPAAAAFMRRIAPRSEACEDIPLAAALFCHVRLLYTVLERQANRCAEEFGLTIPQWMALGCISHCGEEGIPHSELGNRLMLSKAPITGVVDRLERDGYVHRVDDLKDRRISRVVVTPEGEQVWKNVRQTLRTCAVEQCSSLSEEEQLTLLSLMARLLDAASSTDPILESWKVQPQAEPEA